MCFGWHLSNAHFDWYTFFCVYMTSYVLDVSADSRCDTIGTSYLSFVNYGNVCQYVPQSTCLRNQLESFHSAGNNFANALGNVSILRETSMWKMISNLFFACVFDVYKCVIIWFFFCIYYRCCIFELFNKIWIPTFWNNNQNV